MNLLLKICFLTATLSFVVSAQEPQEERPDIKLSDGRLLEKCKIISETPLDAVVIHSKGVENVKWEAFPKEYQKKYGYNPNNAAVHADKLQKHDVRTIQVSKAKKIVSGLAEKAMLARLEIFQITSDGILAKGFAFVGPPRKELVSSYSSSKKGWGLNPNERVKNINTRFVKKRDQVMFDDYIFVTLDATGHIDGDVIDLIMFPNGTHSYQSVGAGTKTIKKYTTDFISLLSANERALVSELSDNQIWTAFKLGFPD